MRIDKQKIGRKFLVVLHDLVVLNAWVCLCIFAVSFIDDPNWQLDHKSLFLLMNAGYFVGIYFTPIIMDRTSLRMWAILRRCISVGIVICILYLSFVSLLKLGIANLRHNFLVVLLSPLVLFCSRLHAKRLLAWWWARYGKADRLVLVGASDAMFNLYHSLRNMSDADIAGYFADGDLEIPLKRLGSLAESLDFLRATAVDEVYCDFSLDHGYLAKLYVFCENNFIRFFGVPDIYGYLNRKLLVSSIEDIPILAVREEPLLNPLHRILKRLFDIAFSSLVLLFVFFPILVVSAILIKRQSPGPIFFRQKRTGMDGKDFWCLKFRSMHVNDQADSQQATADDPRRFAYGAFMRRTNIDELPQFINVFLGDMSVVGPRPHMLKHTEQYGALIKRYMVRHLAKPGITGWAQVNGLRGETRELRDMERRVRHDIWYVEHWSFWLDVRIIVKTVTNMLFGDKGNAY